MKRVIFTLGIMICLFACKKTESSIAPVAIAQIVQEETIKFTTSIDSGYFLSNDTIPISVNVSSKVEIPLKSTPLRHLVLTPI